MEVEVETTAGVDVELGPVLAPVDSEFVIDDEELELDDDDG